jgi:hypothetical protein
VNDVRQGVLTPSQAFFIDYHLVEVKAPSNYCVFFLSIMKYFFTQSKQKELAILCFLKQVDYDLSDLDSSVTGLRYLLFYPLLFNN